LELIAENFDDFINQVLCAAAVVSIIIGVVQHGLPDGLIEGTSILIALNIIIFVNSGNNYLSEKRLADLVNLSEKQMVPVYRGSKEAVSIDANELVVGDLIDIDNGNKVPADLIMVSGQDIACVEADLTGEPDMLPIKLSMKIICKITEPYLLRPLSKLVTEKQLLWLLVQTPQLVKLLSKHRKLTNQLIFKINLRSLLTKLVTLVSLALSLHSALWLSELL